MNIEERILDIREAAYAYADVCYRAGKAYTAFKANTISDDFYNEFVRLSEESYEAKGVFIGKLQSLLDEELAWLGADEEEEDDEEPSRSIFDLDDGFYVISSLSVPQAAIYWKNEDVWSLPYEGDEDLVSRLDALQHHLDNDNVDRLILDYWPAV